MHKLYSKSTFMKMTKEQLIAEIYCYHNNCLQFEKSHYKVSAILQSALKECPEFRSWLDNHKKGDIF